MCVVVVKSGWDGFVDLHEVFRQFPATSGCSVRCARAVGSWRSLSWYHGKIMEKMEKATMLACV